MRRPLLGLSFLFAGGICLENFFRFGTAVSACAAVAALSGFFLFRGKGIAHAFLLCAVFATGLFRLALNESSPSADHVTKAISDLPAWVSVTGVVITDPVIQEIRRTVPKQETQYKVIFNLRLDSITQFGHRKKTQGYLRVIVRKTDRPVAYGDRIEMRGLLRAAQEQKNFFLFDYSKWLKRQDIYHIMTVENGSNLKVLAHDKGRLLNSWGYKLRAKVNQTLKIGLENEPDLSAVLSGMILGYREEIPDNISEEFQRTGTFHILAVSGQNLTFIAFVFIILLRSFGVSKWRCGFVVLPVLILYCASVGWQPGCLRAFWMAAVVIVSWMLIKPFDLLNAVGVAAIVTLAWDPQQLFDVGFQFSFTVVLALIVVTPWIWGKMKSFFEPDPFLIPELVSHRDKLWKYGGGGIAQMAASSLVAWVGSLPFTLLYFHTFAPVTVLANMFIVPMATIILTLGLISFLGGLFHPVVALIYNNANYFFLKLLLAGIHSFSLMPLGCYYFSFNSPTPPQDGFILHCLEAERSQSYILQSRDQTFVIDTGNENCARHILVPTLKALGVNKIDGLILSHADSQHIGGTPYLLRNFPVGQVWMNPWTGRSSSHAKAMEAIQIRKIPLTSHLGQQEVFVKHDRKARVFYPEAAPNSKRADDTCPVVAIQVGAETILMTFDLPEEKLMEMIPLLTEMGMIPVDWIVCGFDSKNSNLPAQFARATMARGMIYSRPEPSSPGQENNDIKLINTSRQGGVMITVDQGKTTVRSAKRLSEH